MEKLYLVNQRELEKLQKPEISLDSEIKNILNNTTLSTYDKMIQYQNVLYKYLHMEQQGKMEPAPINEVKAPEVDMEPIETYAEYLPKSYIKPALNLLNLISKQPDKMKINNNGEIIVKGTLLPETHITDLLKHTISKKPSQTLPVGFNEFKHTLKEMNVPKSLVNFNSSDSIAPYSVKKKHQKLKKLQAKSRLLEKLQAKPRVWEKVYP